MNHPIQIVSIGPDIVELHWPETISEPILFELLTVKNWLARHWAEKIHRMYQGYQVLGMQVNAGVDTESCVSELRDRLPRSLEQEVHRPQVRSWKVPVCYDLQLVPELTRYLEEKSLALSQFIDVHTRTTYRLYCYGFLPGFMYLGGLDECLHVPRKTNPDRKIGAGSVAIGGSQTGIYPMDSPGGWYVVGKTPVVFFKQGRLEVPFRPGDSLRFDPVSLAYFDELQQKESLSWEEWEEHG